MVFTRIKPQMWARLSQATKLETRMEDIMQRYISYRQLMCRRQRRNAMLTGGLTFSL